MQVNHLLPVALDANPLPAIPGVGQRNWGTVVQHHSAAHMHQGEHSSQVKKLPHTSDYRLFSVLSISSLTQTEGGSGILSAASTGPPGWSLLAKMRYNPQTAFPHPPLPDEMVPRAGDKVELGADAAAFMLQV